MGIPKKRDGIFTGFGRDMCVICKNKSKRTVYDTWEDPYGKEYEYPSFDSLCCGVDGLKWSNSPSFVHIGRVYSFLRKNLTEGGLFKLESRIVWSNKEQGTAYFCENFEKDE
jgi:hypothetical protein